MGLWNRNVVAMSSHKRDVLIGIQPAATAKFSPFIISKTIVYGICMLKISVLVCRYRPVVLLVDFLYIGKQLRIGGFIVAVNMDHSKYATWFQ